ncbi:hypothetical protein PTIM40_236 [Cyanophage P-TIM40]|uniref:Gp230 n=1 Tax=Cyanophage P-TIM40 TaxID=1589733 RepID=A0A0C5AEE4_9CAUD|nr:transcriptional regulator [Cyanophage P-TIM40]AJK27639.1 hypothetical protein PTIM40_236 [Cyanophage P-TIM40]|tara:strand:+ start:371 stop:601 length:231 start_codon:yes stop_codon:yes gene_type:complete
MPTYNVVNKETGEKKEFQMSMVEYTKWREDNPEWDKDWQAGVAGTTYGKPKQSDGFKEVMSKIQASHPKANLSRYT